jgi:aminopeptidase N
MTLKNKIDSVDVYLVHPKKYTGVVDGVLQSVDSSRSDAVTHWKHSYPMAFYLLAFSIGDYAHITQDMVWDKDSVRVQNYVFKDQVFWVDSTKNLFTIRFLIW